jgi:gamma-glutamylcyclotransferase (GGCT)/AIG2-like uncharacterized protein YtfP
MDNSDIHGELLPFFVYGTLQRGFKNFSNVIRDRYERILPERTSVEADSMSNVAIYIERFTVFHFDGFPGIYVSEDVRDRVYGELIYLPSKDYHAIVRDLDYLEEYFGPSDPRNVYEREIVRVTIETSPSNDEYVSAFTYRCLLPQASGTPVKGGNWATWLREHALVDVADARTAAHPNVS